MCHWSVEVIFNKHNYSKGVGGGREWSDKNNKIKEAEMKFLQRSWLKGKGLLIKLVIYGLYNTFQEKIA